MPHPAPSRFPRPILRCAAKACKDDASKFCNLTWFFGEQAGQVTGCLRGVTDRLSKKCKKEVFKIKKDAADDYRADPLLYQACKVSEERGRPHILGLCVGLPHWGCMRSCHIGVVWGIATLAL